MQCVVVNVVSIASYTVLIGIFACSSLVHKLSNDQDVSSGYLSVVSSTVKVSPLIQGVGWGVGLMVGSFMLPDRVQRVRCDQVGSK